jgi:hypothetical protein
MQRQTLLGKRKIKHIRWGYSNFPFEQDYLLRVRPELLTERFLKNKIQFKPDSELRIPRMKLRYF